MLLSLSLHTENSLCFVRLSALLFVTGRNKKFRHDLLFGESKDTGLISLTINALYNSIGEHRALKYVSSFLDPIHSSHSRIVFPTNGK